MQRQTQLDPAGNTSPPNGRATPKSTFAGDLQKRMADGALPFEEFHRVLRTERLRADRNEHVFSLLLFDLDTARESRATKDLIRTVVARTRQIDEVGWFDGQRLGVVLPYTSSHGAWKLAGDIQRMTTMPLLPACLIHTYPGQWLPDETTDSKTHSHAPTIASAASPEILFDYGIPRWKRAIDVAGSAIALVVLFPLFLLIAATTAVVSPGPVFLKQKRVGYQGRSFTIWKFRTMKIGADTAVHQQHFCELMTSDVPLTKLDTKGDPRIIPFGNIIRRCCLDELPQLINVLRGDMSLVGPRPCIAFAVSQYRPWQRMRCDAVPGMTGLWQVRGKNRTTFKEMIRLDIAYLRRRSFAFDMRIVLATLPAILGELFDSFSSHRSGDKAVS